MLLRVIRPLPKALRGQACTQCNKLQASWDLPIKYKEPVLICSLCVLYDPSIWDEFTRTTITKIETARGHMFDRGPDSRLLNVKDADDVVGMLALTARVSMLGADTSGPRGP